MCRQGGVCGNKTNHGLRANGATQMYNSGVPEKIIQERTGHRSLKALWMYECVNQQHRAVFECIFLSSTVIILLQLYNCYAKSERVKVSHTTAEAPQTAQYAATSFSFQNLHSCTINISHTPPPQPQQNCTVSNTEMDVDKLIASIDY